MVKHMSKEAVKWKKMLSRLFHPKLFAGVSTASKKEVVLRMMRGEPIDALSRELGIEAYRLESGIEKPSRE